jgi:formyltetrahydrofolate deformylase
LGKPAKHCLFDLILRQQAKEFIAEIGLIITNHLDLQVVVEQFGIDYYHIPINNKNKSAQEANQLKLLRNTKLI